VPFEFKGVSDTKCHSDVTVCIFIVESCAATENDQLMTGKGAKQMALYEASTPCHLQKNTLKQCINIKSNS